MLDSSVLVAAFASPGGLCAGVLEGCIRGHELVISDYILGELGRFLTTRAGWTDGESTRALRVLSGGGQIVTPTLVPANACRDPADLPVLGTAVAGRAEVIVSGDKDLLVLGAYEGIAIYRPREFHDAFLANL